MSTTSKEPSRMWNEYKDERFIKWNILNWSSKPQNQVHDVNNIIIFFFFASDYKQNGSNYAHEN